MPESVPTWAEYEALRGYTAGAIDALTAEVAKLRTDVDALAPKPVWADEFSGSAVDLSKRNVRHSSWASNEESIVTNRPANVSVGLDVLSIKAQKETYTAYSTTKPYTSGYLDSKGKYAMLYGRIEMRAKLPSSKGMWPALWLRPDDGGNGEIDVMEALGHEKTKIHCAIHRDYTGTPHQNNGAYTLPNGGAFADWHTYALDWRADAMRWYVDGVEVWKRDTVTTPWYAECFRKPYHLRLNLQVGGSWAGSPDATTVWPGEMLVDYVRVYK